MARALGVIVFGEIICGAESGRVSTRAAQSQLAEFESSDVAPHADSFGGGGCLSAFGAGIHKQFAGS